MNQNTFVATQYTLDGSAVPLVRCEECDAWTPKLTSYSINRTMLCAVCWQKHQESQP